jgi:hypothetical protein
MKAAKTNGECFRKEFNAILSYNQQGIRRYKK